MRKKYGIIKKAESKGDCLDFMAEQILHMQDPAQWQALCGNFDENIRTLEQLYEVTIVCRDTEIKVNGAEAKVPDESIPISPVLFDFDPALQVDLNLKELFELGSCLTGNPFQHGSLFADENALVGFPFTVNGCINVQ